MPVLRRTVLRTDGLMLADVSCGPPRGWTEKRPAPVFGFVLVRQGLVRGRVDGREQLLDPASAFALQRLPTTSPLAALTVSGHACWIRTQDGQLWFAPEHEGWGVSWGYGGTGCHNLAELLDVLLKDISRPAGRSRRAEGIRWAARPAAQDAQSGSTTYTRAQLAAAQAA
ncbi:hypothetical protein [Streptomyces sp. NPDC051109]|uniref:hypothetical protein n=1 Tax=Streptomyces sp. NPDC051109 TaxID=3365642 RepID=UPI0037A1F298